jgi:hypothetical protein
VLDVRAAASQRRDDIRASASSRAILGEIASSGDRRGEDWTPAARTENPHYALGWFTADVHGVHIVFHNGANPGFRAAIVLVPSSKAGAVILTNGESDRFTNAATRSLLEQLLE